MMESMEDQVAVDQNVEGSKPEGDLKSAIGLLVGSCH